jgi:hypothetical protein
MRTDTDGQTDMMKLIVAFRSLRTRLLHQRERNVAFPWQGVSPDGDILTSTIQKKHIVEFPLQQKAYLAQQ